jgi:hypothetical protein
VALAWALLACLFSAPGSSWGSFPSALSIAACRSAVSIAACCWWERKIVQTVGCQLWSLARCLLECTLTLGGPLLVRSYCLPHVVCSPPRRRWPGCRYLRVPPAGQAPVCSCCPPRFVCRDGRPVAPDLLATQMWGIPYPQTYCVAAHSPLHRRSNIGSPGRKAETAARFPCPNSFRLYLSEVLCEPSLLACVLDALYAAAASCPARWHECLNFVIAGNLESAAMGPLWCYAAGVGCNF